MNKEITIIYYYHKTTPIYYYHRTTPIYYYLRTTPVPYMKRIFCVMYLQPLNILQENFVIAIYGNYDSTNFLQHKFSFSRPLYEFSRPMVLRPAHQLLLEKALDLLGTFPGSYYGKRMLCMMIQLQLLFQKLTFPGVTICNLNILLQTELRDLFNDNSTSKVTKSEMKDLYKSRFEKKSISGLEAGSLIVDEPAATIEELLGSINQLPKATKMKRGHQFNAFIISCRWSGIRCDKG